MATKQLGLSTSALDIFRNCKRCFWIDKNKKIKRPEGIRATLPSGMDDMMKAFVNGLVARGEAVPWLVSIQGGVPFKDRARLKSFMNWRTFQVELPNCTAWGNLDDLIEHEDGRVTVWDFKTKATEPGTDYAEKYYQPQADMYHLLLEGNGMKMTGDAVFTWGWPIGINPDLTMVWGWKNLLLETDPARAVALLNAAVDCLKGPEPEQSRDCNYCSFVAERS